MSHSQKQHKGCPEDSVTYDGKGFDAVALRYQEYADLDIVSAANEANHSHNSRWPNPNCELQFPSLQRVMFPKQIKKTDTSVLKLH